mgnify:FL=1
MLSSTACGAAQISSNATSEERNIKTELATKENQITGITELSESETDSTHTGTETLVVYFSATGHTKAVAEKIADVTGADLYEIVPADPYCEADLDYNDDQCRANIEMNDQNVRPEIAGEPISLDAYSTIYLAYPIWWGDAPRIMSTFVESYDFSNQTIIPFCTSGSSKIDKSESNLKTQSGGGNWLAGSRLDADSSEEEIQSWIDGLS